ncbi:M15 family metallopeptidase [Halodesulfovibrio spirochaetisodalis]|uniref:Peptidase M15 n=1 Tax=Halodesulfovibrio spirochaetisodalis TaxID=1560234 RepID=A0A1B7XH79_9BACT|nr:M15 family metallopeptidase [Halodesulfovibrio spirochaetisodalis]OBQ54864.1 peptidase M15 [Halodesulfovibrio spirochaetisodalis]
MNRRFFLQQICIASAVAMPCNSFAAGLIEEKPQEQHGQFDLHVKDYISKMSHFDSAHPDDIVLKDEDLKLLKECTNKITRVMRTVGYGNFNLVSIDQAFYFGKQYSRIGIFSKEEKEFLEKMFYYDADTLGFYGEKPITAFTQTISRKDVIKIRHSGHYLFRGHPFEVWKEIKSALGSDVILTSGVRGIVKQFHLFLMKASSNGGNLSLASRSLAPPGYSFHGISDFDVGQRKYGEFNFTSRFTETRVFTKLSELGYLTLRYPRGNMLGVRYEPWHVKVSS